MGSPGPQSEPGAADAFRVDALDELLPEAYDDLRRLAQGLMARERPGHTLDATALVHEAYLKLAGQQQLQWKNRAQLIGLAALAIRRILVDHARGKARGKRGGGYARVTLTGVADGSGLTSVDLLDLDDALQQLARIDATDARIVELRYFAGLSLDEIAALLNASERTVRRRWSYARAWLYRFLAPA